MRPGKWNISAGLLFLAGFMVYGFALIYLRDFAPDKAQWIAEYSTGKHFEARLAHVHGNLFAFLNVTIGYLLIRLPVASASARWVSRLSLLGMLMPIGILAELLFGAPPAFVLLGGVSMVVAVAWLGIAAGRVLVGADPGYVVFRPLLLYNTTMGFMYVAAGIAIWRDLVNGRNAAGAIFALHLLVFALILVAYGRGGGVAGDSLRAMTLRTSVWLALFVATVWLERSRMVGSAEVRCNRNVLVSKAKHR